MPKRRDGIAAKAGGLSAGCLWVLAAVFAEGFMVACADSKNESADYRVAARVNKEEIAVHQVDVALSKLRGIKAEQAEAAGRRALDRLVDQELMAQRAEELGLDRDPRVRHQVEAARREAVARIFAEQAESAARKPSAEQVKKYYVDNPNLFRDRRVYSIQEISIDTQPEKLDALRHMLRDSHSIGQFMDYLKANDIEFTGTQSVRPAEQLPSHVLDSVVRMKSGQAMLSPSSNGANVFIVIGSKSQPVSEEDSKLAIEQFLFNEAKRSLVKAEVGSLRAASRIEYRGKFANGAAPEVGSANLSRPAFIFDGLAADVGVRDAEVPK